MRRIALALILSVPLLVAWAAPAEADHGHNCVWSGGAWVGQGLCPGMPGFTPHTDAPTPTPAPTVTATPEPTVTSTTPSPQPSTPQPTSTSAPTPTSTPTSAPSPTRTPGCLSSYGNVWCTGGATPSTSVAPAPVVGPLVETDIPFEHRNIPRSW